VRRILLRGEWVGESNIKGSILLSNAPCLFGKNGKTCRPIVAGRLKLETIPSIDPWSDEMLKTIRIWAVAMIVLGNRID